MNQLLDQSIQINKKLFMNYQLPILLLSFGDCHLWHLGEKCSLKGVVRGSCEIAPLPSLFVCLCSCDSNRNVRQTRRVRRQENGKTRFNEQNNRPACTF